MAFQRSFFPISCPHPLSHSSNIDIYDKNVVLTTSSNPKKKENEVKVFKVKEKIDGNSKASPLNYDSIKGVKELKATFGISSEQRMKFPNEIKREKLRKVIKKKKLKTVSQSTRCCKAQNKKRKIAKRKYKVLKNVGNKLFSLKSKISKNSKKEKKISFLSDSEFGENTEVAHIKLFRPKKMNKSNKNKLLNLIRCKTQKNSNKMKKFNMKAKISYSQQLKSINALRNRAER